MAYDVVLEPDEATEKVILTDYHWTIENYVSAIHLAQGAVLQVLELPASYAADGKPVGEPAYLLLQVERARLRSLSF